MLTLTLMYGCAWTFISPHWQSHNSQIVTTDGLGRGFIKTLTCTSLHNLRMVMIQCGIMDAASSLFMHWCWLWLWCMDVPGLSYHHIGKVTMIKLSRLVTTCWQKDPQDIYRHILLALIYTIWGQWRSNVLLWIQPVACSCTDVNFDSDVWMYLDVHITTLAKSQ